MKYYALYFPTIGIVGVTTKISEENRLDIHIEVSKEEFDTYASWEDNKEKQLEIISRPQFRLERTYVLKPVEE